MSALQKAYGLGKGKSFWNLSHYPCGEALDLRIDVVEMILATVRTNSIVAAVLPMRTEQIVKMLWIDETPWVPKDGTEDLDLWVIKRNCFDLCQRILRGEIKV